MVTPNYKEFKIELTTEGIQEPEWMPILRKIIENNPRLAANLLGIEMKQ